LCRDDRRLHSLFVFGDECLEISATDDIRPIKLVVAGEVSSQVNVA